MRNEWQTYWRDLGKSLKSYWLALGVSLIFYVVAIPSLNGIRAHLVSLGIGWVYATVIFTWIIALRAIHKALLTQRALEGKPPLKTVRLTGVILSFSGTAFGLLNGMFIESRLTGEAFVPSAYLNGLVVSFFIATMFQFYFAYKASARENLELKAAKAESELHVLRNQMQPHFLFNSLNSLASLIDQNPGDAGLATQQLADLYRLILASSQTQLSPLQQEFEIARLYLAMEKIRFGSRLETKIQLPTEGRLVAVPSLIVQTLVENAVKHGISKSLHGGFVELRVKEDTNGWRVSVSNSGAPLEKKDGGTGVKNSHERLELVFPGRHQFSLTSDGQKNTIASFVVPL